MPADTTQTQPPATPPPGRPAALTREQVLAAALEIIDQDGVDALTMRRLGQALDRNPMGIYRHAADKDALLDGVVEHIFSELVVSPERGSDRESGQQDGGWEAALRRTAHAAQRPHGTHSGCPRRTSAHMRPRRTRRCHDAPHARLRHAHRKL